MTDDNPYRQFYEEGGYVQKKGSKKRLQMALWGSQYMADGGSVKKSPDVNQLVKAMIELHRACGGRV